MTLGIYLPYVRLEEVMCVDRDHRLLVRRYHPYRHRTAWRADKASVADVGCRVYADADPSQTIANGLTNRSRVLPDPSRKDEPIQASESADKSARLHRNAIDEQLYRLGGMGIIAGEQRAYVRAQAGDA